MSLALASVLENLEFYRLQESKPAESTSTLLYGATKSGKTDFMGSAGDRMLFINNGMGKETFYGKRFKDRPVNPIMIDVPIDSKDEQERIFERIKRIVEHALDKFPDDFDTICIDDSTAVRKSTIIEAIQFNKDMGTSQTQKKQADYDVTIPVVQDYGAEMEFTSKFIADTIYICKAAKKHFMMGAHERLTFEKGKNIGDIPKLIRITPSFTGVDKNPDYISGLFDNVWRTEMVGGGERTIYRIRTIGDESLTAGTRYSGIFPEFLRDTTFLQVVNKIKQFHEGKVNE